MSDNVNSPNHYKLNPHGIEAIDAIQASMTDEEFCGYLKGNIIKYVWRYRRKGKPSEDLQKAQWYLKRLTDEVSRRENIDKFREDFKQMLQEEGDGR